ncbi:uncharacterized protein LOC126266491 [Aethina tumida]|uniref:uncharacterized protein LOC126266491 n=1 Tax=Aethina tumida TaxID=116153 RepID=UPI0021474668|nr:uncharacterized protein LOC126266491 [Aethina tumida]
MKILIVMCIFICLAMKIESLSIEERKCVMCLCHAITGCYSRQNCASYSISRDYWNLAGRPKVDGLKSYEKCMKDKNCIVETILRYTGRFENADVNCDGQFDCIDRFAIHLFGSNYEYPNFGKTYTERFNSCNKMANSSVAQITNYTIGCLARIGRN